MNKIHNSINEKKSAVVYNCTWWNNKSFNMLVVIYNKNIMLQYV